MTGRNLTDKIARRIRAEGPLSVAAYMAMALYDPELGYYATRQPIGALGDFITAPEISQIFGELIGLWCALMWEEIGRPDPVILTELGPGSGALAADLLRAAAASPQFRRALRLYLVEVSPILRRAQQRRLGTDHVVWLTRIEDLPEGPLLLVANEFLDALPIRQLVRGRCHWAERLVALDPEGRFAFADGTKNQLLSLLIPQALRRGSPPGAIFEICPSALALAGTLAARLRRRQGAVLFIDYGRSHSATGGSLRAISDHRSVDPLSAPGHADLSADVDFAAFAEAARIAGADTFGPVPQGAFLRRLGAVTRLGTLSARASPQQRDGLEAGLRRLLDPDQMGTLFKVMMLTSPGLRAPPGFEDDQGATR
ncbi:MAG: SAM-dependent methyltransferase [Alphaproteobacteria bacterium]|nr:SAM-dependent methyltransferase [Alphaproteobacteria bacterium]